MFWPLHRAIGGLGPLPQHNGWVNLQRLRQPVDVFNADVAFAAFNGPDVSSVQSREVRQGFLRETARFPFTPEVKGK